jgi:hypothetical protein
MTLNYDEIEQVSLVTGQILHEGTGKPVIGDIRITVLEGDVVGKVLEDGTFVISGQPKLLFPELSSKAYKLNLKIRAESLQFRQGFAEVNLSVIIPQAIPNKDPFERPISKKTPADLSPILILLSADPVNLGGYVFDAKNLGTRVANATLELLQPITVTNSTSTSANPRDLGRYRFNNITVKAPAKIKCSAPNFLSETRDLLIDFTKSLNEEYFRLVPS